MLTTLGMLEEPFGSTRLHVARLVASLLYTSSSSHAVIAQELCRLNTMDLLLVRGLFPYFNTERKVGAQWVFFFFFQDLFFKYTWNNFLHLQVELCVAAIVRPCAHEMRLQPGLGSQEKPHLDASQDESLSETPSQPLVSSDNSAYNLMVTHVGVSSH